MINFYHDLVITGYKLKRVRCSHCNETLVMYKQETAHTEEKTIKTDIQVASSKHICDPGKKLFYGLSGCLETLEMSVAKGEESDDVDEKMEALEEQISKLPWEFDMDSGDIIPKKKTSKEASNE